MERASHYTHTHTHRSEIYPPLFFHPNIHMSIELGEATSLQLT